MKAPLEAPGSPHIVQQDGQQPELVGIAHHGSEPAGVKGHAKCFLRGCLYQLRAPAAITPLSHLDKRKHTLQVQ